MEQYHAPCVPHLQDGSPCHTNVYNSSYILLTDAFINNRTKTPDANFQGGEDG